MSSSEKSLGSFENGSTNNLDFNALSALSYSPFFSSAQIASF